MTRVGPFELVQPLGRGGAGEVWRATHRDGGPAVAVKLLHADVAVAWRDQVRREVEALARLDHPSVAWLYDHGEDADAGPWLAVELASGGALSSRLPLAWSQAREVLGAVLKALAHAHARGILHRDVKPGNVILCTDDDPRPGPKLVDFGLAALPSRRGASGLSQAYAPPEQREGRWRDEGPWTDLFAVGAMAWELVCGSPPGAADWSPDPDHPEGLVGWVEGLMAPDPADRPRSAARALAALRELKVPIRPTPMLAGRRTFDDLEREARPLQLPPRRSPASLGLFGLRALPVVGRDAECAALLAELRTASAGHGPRFVEVGGSPGAGRSHLLEWLAIRAREEDRAVVLEARWNAAGTGWDGLLGMLTDHLGCSGLAEDAAEVRIAGRHPALAGPLAALISTGNGDAVALTAQLLAELDEPVLLLLDEPGPEAGALVRLLRRTRPPRTLVVVAGELEGPSARIELGALPEPVALLQALDVRDGGVAAELAARAGDRPGDVVRLVSRLVRAGWLVSSARGLQPRPDAGPLPADWFADAAALLDEALGGADAPSLELLALLGLVVAPAEWDAACAEAGLAPERDRLDRLVRHGVIRPGDPMRFELAPARDLLIDRARSAGRLAALAGAAAGGVGGARRAERAGQLLFEAGRFAEAAPLLFQGAVLRTSGENGPVATLLLARCAEAARRAGLRELAWRVPVLRSALLANEGDLAGAVRAVDEALATDPSPAERARVQRIHAEILIRAGRPRAALAVVDEALPAARAETQGQLLLVAARAAFEAWDDAGAARFAERALALPDGAGRALQNLALYEAIAGDVGSARRRFAASSGSRVPEGEADFTLFLGAFLDLAEGRPADARGVASAALPRIRAHRNPWVLSGLLSVALCTLGRDEPDAAGWAAELRETLGGLGTTRVLHHLLDRAASQVRGPLQHELRELADAQLVPEG